MEIVGIALLLFHFASMVSSKLEYHIMTFPFRSRGFTHGHVERLYRSNNLLRYVIIRNNILCPNPFRSIFPLKSGKMGLLSIPQYNPKLA